MHPEDDAGVYLLHTWHLIYVHRINSSDARVSLEVADVESQNMC